MPAQITITFIGGLLLFVGIGVHPSLILTAAGLVLSLIGIIFRFEKRTSRRR